MKDWFLLCDAINDDPVMFKFTSGEKWFWIQLLCLASQNEEKGIINLPLNILAKKVRRKIDKTKTLLELFLNSSLISKLDGDKIQINYLKYSRL